jgi:hypothetical protein
MSATYASAGRDDTAAGKVILMMTSSLAAVLVILGLIYAAGTGQRHIAAMAAAGCEPSLFISGLPCTTAQMMASEYLAIATPANKQLAADVASYTTSEGNNLAAAEEALSAEVASEQAFDKSLAAQLFTPQNRATADELIQNATSTGTPVPLASALFTPQVTAIANALIQDNQARATLTAEQAQASSLTKMRSFNHRVQVASAAVETEVNLIRKALGLPPTAS